LNHRPLGYKGNSPSHALPNHTARCHETLAKPAPLVAPFCFALLTVHGQKADRRHPILSRSPDKFCYTGCRELFAPTKDSPFAEPWFGDPCSFLIQHDSICVAARRGLEALGLPSFSDAANLDASKIICYALRNRARPECLYGILLRGMRGVWRKPLRSAR
jgi:hypothetical protein